MQDLTKGVEYVNSFYNEKKGIYPIKGATTQLIEKAVKIYYHIANNWDYSNLQQYGLDTVDRERIRGILEIMTGVEVTQIF